MSFEAGPQLGLLLSSKLKTNESNNNINGLKTLDFGLNAGLEYYLSNGVSLLQGRYNLGLTDTGFTGDSNKRASNSVFQFSIGYLF